MHGPCTVSSWESSAWTGRRELSSFRQIPRKHVSTPGETSFVPCDGVLAMNKPPGGGFRCHVNPVSLVGGDPENAATTQPQAR